MPHKSPISRSAIDPESQFLLTFPIVELHGCQVARFSWGGPNVAEAVPEGGAGTRAAPFMTQESSESCCLTDTPR